MKIQQFNRESCRVVRDAIEKALAPVAEQFGVQVKLGSGTFSAGSFTVKVTASAIGEGGYALTPEAESFQRNAALYGLKPEDLFAEITLGQERYQLIGLKASSTKYPLLAKKLSNGKTYKLGLDTTLLALGRKTRSQALVVGVGELNPQ